jgi:hypothetical protein
MLFHPHITSQLAETRAAEHHNAAGRAREASAARHDVQPSPSLPSIPLDAYPRLCGLPVTIERASANGATPAYRAARPRFRTMPRRWLRVRDD